MKLFRTVQEVQEHRQGRASVGLVPTMGAFHEGHIELMRRAKEECDTVYVSIFVNPTQFGPDDDLNAYPRNEQRDLELATKQRVDAVFAPPVEEVYTGSEQKIIVENVTELWEGEHRPGHFEGVATVVYRLFEIFNPDRAYFGLKDLQQCAVIKKMVSDNKLPLQIVTVETVREDSGLALSSRNAYLEQNDRIEAALLYKTLTDAAGYASIDGSPFPDVVDSAKSTLNKAGFDVEYIAFVNPETMREVTQIIDNMRIVCAAHFRGVRLIDNILCP